MNLHHDGCDHDFSRRGFLGRAAQVFFGVSVLPALGRFAPAQDPQQLIRLDRATARNVIFLFMRGGMSQIDTFDPKPGHENQGPVQAIPTRVDGIQLSQHFPLLAEQMDKVCVINSLTSKQGAHQQAQYLFRTSYDLRGTIQHPSLGAWVNLLRGKLNPTLPGHVLIGGANMPTAGFLPPQYIGLPIGDPESGLQNCRLPAGIDDKRFRGRLDRLQQMNREFEERYAEREVQAYREMYDDAVRLMSSSDLKAFEIAGEPQRVRDAYGSDNFGQGCLLARRLVEHGVRFVEVVSDGWDTHNDNFDQLTDRCPAIDRGLATLLADLHSRGLLDETLVVLATEFGRTPQIANGDGRNHFPKAFSALLAGGGVRGGMRYGRTTKDGMDIDQDPVTIQDFNATIACALGLPTDHVIHSPSGRPFKIADKGIAIRDILA